MDPGQPVNLEDLPAPDGVPSCPECGAPLDICWATLECTECDWWCFG